LASIDDGLRVWLAAEIEGAGLQLVPHDQVAASLAALTRPGPGFAHAGDAPRIGAATQADLVVFVAVDVDAGATIVRLRVHDGNSGDVLAVSKAEGTLASLGDVTQRAAQPIIEGLGGRGGAPAPTLSHLGRLDGVARSIREGQLAEAWIALDGQKGAAASLLRTRIEFLASQPDTPLTERSRLASLRGVKDRGWLVVRQGLVDGTDPAFLLAGAQSALAREDVAPALKLYDEASALAPERVDLARGRAALMTRLGQHDEARQAWQDVLSRVPGDLEAHRALAENAAVPAPLRAQHHLEAGAAQVIALDVEGARRSFDAASTLDPGLATTARRQEASLDSELGNHAEALLGFEELAAGGDDTASTVMGLARARSRNGDPVGAEQAWRVVLERDPDGTSLPGDVRSEVEAGIGQALVAQDQPEDAVPHFQRALVLEPERVAARRGLARAHRVSGRIDEALVALDPASVAPHERAELLADVAELQTDAARGEEAIATLKQAVLLEPDDPSLRHALATAYETGGQLELAHSERALASELTGGESAPDEVASEVAEVPEPGTVSAGLFADLVDSFPTKAPHGPWAIERVVFLGVHPVDDAVWTAREWLMPRHLDRALLAEAIAAALAERYQVVRPENVPELAEPAVARVRAFGRKPDDIALVNDVTRADAAVVVQIAGENLAPLDPPGGPVSLEVRFAGGRDSGEVFLLGNQARLPEASRFVGWNLRALAPWGALLALLLLPMLRGWGTLEVELHYETRKGAKGFFSIQLSRRPGRAKTETKEKSGRSKALRYQNKPRPWHRFTRHMAGTHTRFRWVPARRTYVLVHGLQQDASTHEVIGNYVEEREVTIERGRITKASFDFRPKQAAIELRLTRAEGQEGCQVQLALKGVPDSLRYVREETTTVHVGPGRHVVMAAVDGRVYEVVVDVVDLAHQVIYVPLGNPEGSVFQGCPEAVDPYLQGDLEAASDALAAAGQAEEASLLRAVLLESRGETSEAARLYEEAGDLTHAAELHEAEEAPEESAELYEQAGEHDRAADAYASAGDLLKAAQAWETAYEFDKAIDAYREAGDLEKTTELLERTGRYFEAGTIALTSEDEERGICNLQMVDLRDPDYMQACLQLAEVFGRREELPLAIDKAREAVSAGGGEHAPVEMVYGLASLLEQNGEVEEALGLFEAVVSRDYLYEDAATRADHLRGVAATSAEMPAAPAPAPTQPAASSDPGEGRYEILEEIGRGGMGIVFKARDRRLGRVVALKRLPDNLKDHPTAVQLFLREARSAAALNHPNIVTLFDADQSADGNVYLTMELLEGLPIDAILKKRGRLSPKDALRLMHQTATGLQFAHESRIVHRDVKTANLFFTKDRIVKIMDFGLAKMMEEVRRAATVIGGTPYYMAPEQAVGENVDHRADLYALGVTLYELLTGRVPFTEGDVTYHHRHTEPPDPRSFVPDLPPALVELVLQLLAKSPADRPAETAQVTAGLESLLKDC
jgi:tetratricopeptide (TPR) repeat protein